MIKIINIYLLQVLKYSKNILKRKKKILCLCNGTGFDTLSGNLIRLVFYLKKEDVRFLKDSHKVLKIIGVIFVIGFLDILPSKIFDIVNESKERKKNVKRGIIGLRIKIADLLVQAVPPELHLCLIICLSIAQNRCKKKNIVSINKDKINSAGKISVFIFDNYLKKFMIEKKCPISL